MHTLAFRTQYAELKERSAAAGPLLPGTPGLLVLRSGTGYGYWYRRYYAAPGQEVEDYVCKDGDDEALAAARDRMAFADWAMRQVRDLRKLQFQVADKATARVLVELHNAGLLAGGANGMNGFVVVGTLGYMAWLNELGARAVSAQTQDVDLARRQDLKLAAPRSFLQTIEATKLRFAPVPGLPNGVPSTAVKRQGAEGLRIDVLAHGELLGQVVPIPELEWHAQAIPHYDYLLRESREAAMLAGGHCTPVQLAAPERFVWHKLYSSAARAGFPEKARKDLVQAATLAAVLVEQDDAVLSESLAEVPDAMLAPLRTRLAPLRKLLAKHPQTLEQFEHALGRVKEKKTGKPGSAKLSSSSGRTPRAARRPR
ncbi:MAG TPA: GSU2403 family nucleotidyltransferase fold protein [Burkholderiaceae bacterium]